MFNTPLGYPFLFRPLLHAQNYTWCRANPTTKISIFGLLTIPSGRKCLEPKRRGFTADCTQYILLL